MAKTVKIQECYGEYKATISRHQTNDTAEAIQRAITKRYGSKAIFREDLSMRGSRNVYGQAFKPIKGTSSLTNLTWQICITAE